MELNLLSLKLMRQFLNKKFRCEVGESKIQMRSCLICNQQRDFLFLLSLRFHLFAYCTNQLRQFEDAPVTCGSYVVLVKLLCKGLLFI